MSHSDKPLEQQTFTFGGHELRVWCRRLPSEVSRVTQTLQLDAEELEELFASVLDFPSDHQKSSQRSSSQAAAAAAAGGAAPGPGRSDGAAAAAGSDAAAAAPEAAAAAAAAGSAAAAAKPDSKKLCGNVAADQPDLIGLDVWPAAVALCTYLAAHPRLAAGADVCELGAGMGLPGLLCAALGARSVLLTDYEPQVVDRMRDNARLSGVAAACAFLPLDWFDLSPLPPADRGAKSLLLLADVIYAAAVVGPLVATLRALLAPEGVALVAHRIRRPLIFDREDRVARLQERDEIFEQFQAECRAAAFHLRFLNGASPAARAGDEPLLLVIGASEAALQRFPAIEAEEEGAAADSAAAASSGAS